MALTHTLAVCAMLANPGLSSAAGGGRKPPAVPSVNASDGNTAASASVPGFAPYRLRCDGSNLRGGTASASFAIDNRRPRFTWAAVHPERGQRQSAYRIEIKESYGDPDGFNTLPHVWDSGRVESSEPSHDSAGTATAETINSTTVFLPRSDTVYLWQVTLWDLNGRRSTSGPTASEVLRVADGFTGNRDVGALSRMLHSGTG